MSMIDEQVRRREELRINPRSAATPAPTGGKGSRGNTGHLNLDTPLLPASKGSKKMVNYRARVAALSCKRAKRKAAEAARRLPGISEYRKRLISQRIRMVAYIRELASLDRTVKQAAALLGRSHTLIWKKVRNCGIVFTRETALRKAVRAGYAEKKAPKVIAAELGRNVSTIKVIASKMGLTKGNRPDPGKFTRGFEIPDEMLADYRHMTKHKAIRAREAGEILGLVARQIDPRYTQSDQEAPRP